MDQDLVMLLISWLDIKPKMTTMGHGAMDDMEFDQRPLRGATLSKFDRTTSTSTTLIHPDVVLIYYLLLLKRSSVFVSHDMLHEFERG